VSGVKLDLDPSPEITIARVQAARSSLKEFPPTYEEPVPFLHVYQGEFEGQPFIDAFEDSSEWMAAATGGSGSKTTISPYRDSRALTVLRDFGKEKTLNDTQRTGLPILYAVERAVWHYRETHDLVLKNAQGWTINKYGHGGNYLPHTDHGPNDPRVLSCVVYLNTVTDGGRTFFLEWDWQSSCIEGNILLFPSSYPYIHEAEPVGLSDPTQVKYSMVTWFL
jgi:hypothetical protein